MGYINWLAVAIQVQKRQDWVLQHNTIHFQVTVIEFLSGAKAIAFI